MDDRANLSERPEAHHAPPAASMKRLLSERLQDLTLPSLDVYDYSSHQEIPVKELQLREAKATLSAVVDQAVDGEPCLITRHGKPEAVIVSFREWERLSRVPSFARLLMAVPAEVDAKRNATPVRDADL